MDVATERKAYMSRLVIQSIVSTVAPPHMVQGVRLAQKLEKYINMVMVITSVFGAAVHLEVMDVHGLLRVSMSFKLFTWILILFKIIYYKKNQKAFLKNL